jgi:hypothetical protein
MSETTGHLAASTARPWQSPWPADELEHVSECPVCESTARQLLHDNLVDNVFFVAVGRWQLYRCMQCRSAYLDPRPDAASIGKAYETYYTHVANDGRKDSDSARDSRRLKARLSNGYANDRYGTTRQPASPWGKWLARFLPHQRQKLDAAFRYLPKPVAGHVRTGSIESLEAMSGCFDAITISHVLEHVHCPRQVVRAIGRLLKPGGVLYIDTPNIDSNGARRWGANWRGFETPRHLVLFSLGALVGLLEASGFGNVSVKRRTVVRKFLYLSSLRMQRGGSPYERKPAKLPMMMRIRLKYASVPAEHDEFLTLVATRKSE